MLETKQRALCDYAGYIVNVTHAQIGLSPDKEGKPVLWLPISELRHVHYLDGGAVGELKLNQRIVGLDLPRWLGINRGLLKGEKTLDLEEAT